MIKNKISLFCYSLFLHVEINIIAESMVAGIANIDMITKITACLVIIEKAVAIKMIIKVLQSKIALYMPACLFVKKNINPVIKDIEK